MRASPFSSESHSAFPFLQAVPSNSTTHSLLFLDTFHFKAIYPPHHSFCTPPSPKVYSFKFNLRPFLYCASKSDPTILGGDEEGQGPVNFSDYDYTVNGDEDGDDYSSGNFLMVDDDMAQKSESLAEDGVYIEVKKLEKNSRRIESRISIDASLADIWGILTDYERLADFIPGLAVSQLLEKGDKYARLLQIGQQNLPFGLKFNAKGIVDCYEKDLEGLPSGMKREIEFKMIEGDFQLFEGKWSILQQSNSGSSEELLQVQEVNTTLSYIVDVKPKLWLPVGLIEGRLCNEIKLNLTSIRDEAQKTTDGAVYAHQLE